MNSSKGSLSPPRIESPSPSPSLPPTGILKHRSSKENSFQSGLLSPDPSLHSAGHVSPSFGGHLVSTGTSSPSLGSQPISRSSTTASNSNYQSRVAFDLLDGDGRSKSGGGTGIDFSFTLAVKTIGYVRNKHTRTFLVATDLNEYSVNALTWLLETLIEDGDEVVVLRVVEPSSSSRSWLEEDFQDEARQEAQRVLDSTMKTNNDERSISIIVEFAVGRVESVIQRMIQIYRPDSLVVGTRGRPMTGWKASLMGSTSRYMLEKSPVPVVVVRPERKVVRDLEARRADPKRGTLFASSAASSRSSSPTRPNFGRASSDETRRGHARQLSDKLAVPLPKSKGVKMFRPRTAPA